MLAQFFVGIFLMGVFTTIRPETAGDNWLQGSDSIRDYLVAYICMSIGCLMLFFCCVGSCGVAARCCPCLAFLVPLTFAASTSLFVISGFGDRIDEAVDTMCNAYKEEIRQFFNRAVDRPMCSDMCPCDDAVFVEGNYTQMSQDSLDYFGRSNFDLAGDESD